MHNNHGKSICTVFVLVATNIVLQEFLTKKDALLFKEGISISIFLLSLSENPHFGALILFLAFLGDAALPCLRVHPTLIESSVMIFVEFSVVVEVA